MFEDVADYVVGIDTGGTYTDGILMDYHTRKLLASAKTLTTYGDLTRGIITVLRELNIKDPFKVKLVGISSTLATNSIAEGRIKPVGLILVGYDQDLIESFDLEDRFVTRRFAYFKGGHNAQGEEQHPLELDKIKSWVRDNMNELSAVAVSSYFSPLNAEHEERVTRAVGEVTEIPVVQGHQLSTALDSIKRATTASVNASLVAVMHEFIRAVKKALKNMRIHAPLMIVKGDGSLMPYTEAAKKPVETVLSGPAASAIGGRFLSKLNNALVIDVGGTTTDMALIEDGSVSVTEEGARVGEIETAVKAARIRTVCIGCDSRIRMVSDREFQVGPGRVVPLSLLVSVYPEIQEEVFKTSQPRRTNRDAADVEYWFMARDMGSTVPASMNPKKQAVIDLLRERPLSLNALLRKLHMNHAVQLGVDDLIHGGYIGVAALTPTDLLHVKGEMDIWHTESAKQALAFLCGLFDRNPMEFVDEVLDHMVARMTEEAIIFLARHNQGCVLPDYLDSDWAKWFFEEAFAGKDQHVAVTIAGRAPIIGIGAPADIFVRRVAEKLHTRFILPPHPHVANAVGAVAGSVIVEKEALVYVQENPEARSFIVQFDGKTTSFTGSAEAMEFASKRVSRAARGAAGDAGADHPLVHVEKRTEGALHRIHARAVGNPGLSEQFG